MRLALTVSLVAAIALAAGAAPDPVPWMDADRHVGRLVVVEGYVRAVEREGRRLTLLFDPADARALRVTLMIPLVTDLPPEPEALYRERRVRVHGRVTRTAGHLDLIVTDPDRISVAGLTTENGAPRALDETPAPAPEVAPPAPPTTATTLPSTPEPPRPSPDAAAAGRAQAACERLGTSQEAARRDALDAVAALRACLEAGRSGCRTDADAIAAPIARLEWIEQQRRARCPAGF